MIEQKYLVDTNALGFIGAKRRGSRFFRERCRVTEDVRYEARFTVRESALTGLTVSTTPRVLQHVSTIMATVPVGDTALLDLYGNKGAADPLLLATALAMNEDESGSLFGDEWVLVTADGALTAKAKEFGIATAAPEDLATLIDQSVNGDA